MGHTVNQGGTADIVYYSSLTGIFLSGTFCLIDTIRGKSVINTNRKLAYRFVLIQSLTGRLDKTHE